MGFPSTAGSWDAEDDFLLKNAVEAGASLESLAKGAVCFSHKFTLQELQDRWRSLLYDSETSAQASARIVKFETEFCTSSPGKKRFNSKGKVYSRRKRKIYSVKHQYSSRRKRVCHEPCLSAAFGYALAPCSCIRDDSGCVCGGLLKPLEGHRLVHTLDPAAVLVNNYGHIDESYDGRQDGRQDVHHKDNQNYLFHPNHANAAESILIDGTINDEFLHGCSSVGQPYRCDNVPNNPRSSERNIAPLKDLPDLQDYANPQQPLLGDQYGNGVAGSKILLDTDRDGVKQNQFSESRQQLSSGIPMIHTWSKFEDVKSPDMLTDMHTKEEHITFFCDKKLETFSSDTFASLVNGISDSGLDNASLSENESMHACSMNCGQSKDFELLNGKNISGSALDTDQEDLGDFSSKVVTEDISRVHLLGLSDSHASNTCDYHIYPIDRKHSMTAVYGTDMVPTPSEVPFPGCTIECSLNTEDSEIPCNDDALMHGQPPFECTSTSDQNSHHIMCLVSIEPTHSENGGDSNHFDSVEDVQASSVAMKMEPSTFEQKENWVALNETCNLGNQVSDQINCKFLAEKADISRETATRNCMASHGLPDMEFHNPIATMYSSDQAEKGSDDEKCVPNYFDIEALILNQDLIPWDQESDFVQSEVSRFQYLGSRKDLIRLEQGARSYMNRSIMSQGAFAIIYGRYLKYYIKDPEVTLGRETEEVHVDIDLAKEGNANKISRRQAVIKMDEVGSFHIKNIGKYPIFVNGNEVPSNRRINCRRGNIQFIYWVKILLETGTSSVLVNGVPGRNFRCRRGVRQGDPLSPLLFVLAGEIMQYVINDLKMKGLLKLPIEVGDEDFPVVQYADDTLLVLEADPAQLTVLKKALQDFSTSTGLTVNFHKSCMLPINISDDLVGQLANGFGCIVGSYPFTYLGLPMGTTRPRMSDLLPLVTKMERKLTASSMFLAYGGRLQLIRSCLSSMSVYFLCSLDIPPGIIKQLYRIIRQCLWRGNHPDSKKQSLASLDMICKPKKSGGLGIVDFHKQNQGLLLKHLHKFFNKEQVPWVQLVWRYYPNGVPQAENLCGSFWWRDIMKLAPIYQSFCTVKVGSGDTALFWSNKWNGEVFQLVFPRLFSFALNPQISVKEMLSSGDRSQFFALPLSQQAYEEYQSLEEMLSENLLDPSVQDEWRTIWKDGIYTSHRYYQFCFRDQRASKVYDWIWASKVLLKLKVFAWLMVSDRLNTRDMLRRRHWNVTNVFHCVLCPTHTTEDWLHLFFHCNFSIRIWNYLQIQWTDGDSFEQVFTQARQQFSKPFFAEVVILASWHIWKQRNEAIFQNVMPSFRSWRRGFVNDITLHKHRVKAKHVIELSSWIDNLA